MSIVTRRKRRKLTSSEMLLTPVIDIIDLTEDSPQNKATRNKCQRSEMSTNVPRQPTTLQESIIIDDYLQNQNENIDNNIAVRTTSEIINLDETGPANDNNNPKGFLNDSINKKVTPLTCPICLDELSSKCEPKSTKCGHIYCKHCLETIVKEKKKCPLCKKAINLKSCIRLYF
ncbi:peroxisome biogenesis factor 10-like [Prorops nasuta]|uniref:peroxisome biogenesis factor 10-like n=1 Tax=Prorops nasuta TaxID=863751 RepID=UPI0034CFCC7D